MSPLGSRTCCPPAALKNSHRSLVRSIARSHITIEQPNQLERSRRDRSCDQHDLLVTTPTDNSVWLDCCRTACCPPPPFFLPAWQGWFTSSVPSDITWQSTKNSSSNMNLHVVKQTAYQPMMWLLLLNQTTLQPTQWYWIFIPWLLDFDESFNGAGHVNQSIAVSIDVQ